MRTVWPTPPGRRCGRQSPMPGPGRPPPRPARMRLLWIGNLVLALAFLALAATGDSWFPRLLGVTLAAVTLLMARAWFRQERIARREAG